MKKIFKQSLLIIIIMVKFDFKNATLNTENSKKRINKTYFHHHNNIKKKVIFITSILSMIKTSSQL